VKVTEYEVSYYAAFSGLLPLPPSQVQKNKKRKKYYVGACLFWLQMQNILTLKCYYRILG
jgi:hypothetical protein